MKRNGMLVSGVLALMLAGCANEGGWKDERLAQAATQPGPLGTFLQGCEHELQTYCPSVTPGEGRLVACLYAHEDKISPRCELAMYHSLDELDRMVAALEYAAHRCEDDLVKFCSHVTPGEGHLLDCLARHDSEISDHCRQALTDVGLRKNK